MITTHSDFEGQENKSVIASTFPPSIYYYMMVQDVMILVFIVLNVKPAFSFSSFTLIKRLFSSSSLSTIKVVSYLRYHFCIFEVVDISPGSLDSSL